MGRQADGRADPSARLGSNRNDILTRVVNDGRMEITDVVPTMSPSMDIQISSNFERVLFELNGRDGGLTTEQMGVFRSSGRMALESDQLRELQVDLHRCERRRAGHARPDRPHLRGLGGGRRPSHRGGVRAAEAGGRRRHPRGRARDRASANSRTRSRRRSAPGPRCPSTSPISSTVRSATRSWRTTSPR